MDNIRLAVLGGDMRQHILYDLFKDAGYIVSKTPTYHNEIVIGPVPCSNDGITLFNTSPENPIVMEELFRRMYESGCRLFIAGAIKDSARTMADANAIEVIDLMNLDEVAVMNAVPTAEGAIAAAMENSDITLFGSRCLVLGYGRCGKFLAHMLNGLGSNVSVMARSVADEAYIKSYGYGFVKSDLLKTQLNEFDFIFNTVPAMMIDKDAMENVRLDCLIIDISSGLGGVDFKNADQMGIKALLLPGLPGRVAPKTAALILKEAIIKILEKRGYCNDF